MIYLRLLFKQLRVKVAVWLVILCGISLSLAPVFSDLFSTEEELRSIEATLDNPAMVALVGPIPEGEYTTGVAFSHEMMIFMAIVHGIFGILIANQVGRRSEDDGLAEYLISGGLKKSTLYFNQIIVGIVINLLAGIIIYSGLTVMNIDSFTHEGNLLYSTGLAFFGMLFYMFTLFIGSIVSSAELTFGISLSVLILMYLYRAVTDVVAMDYSVISPYNWLTRMYPYAEDNFVWLLPFIILVVFAAAGWFLFAKRDISDAYFKAKSHNKPRPIGSYPVLSLLNMRTMIIAWLLGLFVIGLTYGSVFGDLEMMISDNEMLSAAVEAGSIDDPMLFFINMILIISTVIAIIPSLMIVGRILKEEQSARLEVVNSGTLLKKLSRGRVLVTHWVISLFAGLLSMVLTTLGMYLASLNVDNLQVDLGDYFMASLNYFSVILFTAGLGVLLLGISRSLFKLIWAYIGYLFFVAYLGNLVELGDIFHMLTPFHYLNNVPIDNMDWIGFTGIIGVGIVLFIAGLILFKRRDLN